MINASETKWAAVEKNLEWAGAQAITWNNISPTRSAFDDISESVRACREVAIAFVAAGLGAPIPVDQLRSFGVPAIDVGYMFEAWVDSTAGDIRPFTTGDV